MKTNTSAISIYLRAVEKALKRGDATEHTYRPALKRLLESFCSAIVATNEPRRIQCGSPDFVVSRGQIPIGYVEAKDVKIDLVTAEKSDQLTRYRESLGNLILTNYLDFRLYRDGEFVRSVSLASVSRNGSLSLVTGAARELQAMLQVFFDAWMPTISAPQDLAERMARAARLLRDIVGDVFEAEDEAGDLHEQYGAFRQILIAELSVAEFADMYAQTIAYGLFAARCNHAGPGFTRERAGHDLPRTNPFLRKLFNSIAGPDLDERVTWIVDELAEVLAKTDIAKILARFGKAKRGEDAVVHFYETFLAAYDPDVRELRGVYYTPEAVVQFIVESVDYVLKTELDIPDGLADSAKLPAVGSKEPQHRLTVLDPATGTGTFLYSIIDKVRETFTSGEGAWSAYVAEHLLPRLIGFELLMAPYAVAHIKLALKLQSSGYDLTRDERLRVYLTNTLDEPHVGAGLPLFARWLAEEANVAGDIKKTSPVMVILGNPPYSGNSQHSGAWVRGLMRGKDALSNKIVGNYFSCDGEPLGERQARWLNDDYVKFIRFAQWKIETTGHGVLAFITNRNYIDNITFRGMRQALTRAFDKIYVLDLHGDALGGDTTFSGLMDENVFDITKGVAITVFVRSKVIRRRTSNVVYASLRGPRDGNRVELNGKIVKGNGKDGWLRANSIGTIKWQKVMPEAPYYLFKPENDALRQIYRKTFVGVDELFIFGSSGFLAGYKEVAVDYSEAAVVEKFRRLAFPEARLSSEDVKAEFGLADRDNWTVAEARAKLRGDPNWQDSVVPYLARPFDLRAVLYKDEFLIRSVRRVQRHMLYGDNLALLVSRQTIAPFRHVFASRSVATFNVLDNAGRHGAGPFFPLYTHFEVKGEKALGLGAKKEHNLSVEIINDLATNLALTFVATGPGDLRKTFGPEDIFGYVYALLHASAFRADFGVQLKTGFPRIPLAPGVKTFAMLCRLGTALVNLHTLQTTPSDVAPFPKSGDDVVRKVEFTPHASDPNTGRIMINKDQYFEDVPLTVWAYQIGRYQVCHQWLKERIDRKLSYDEIVAFRRVVGVLSDSLAVIAKIDKELLLRPLWTNS
ncbi:hypothetical protein HK20_12960 [Acetobacter sp. DsW_54]|nr:hypothetical protein HK20_12960 [Acetobacter sp. DsW_54]